MNIIRNSLPSSVIAQETLNGTLKILRSLEIALFEGDEDIIPEAFNGFEPKFIAGVAGRATGAESITGSQAWHVDITTAVTADLIQDMRDNPVEEDVFTDLIGTIAEDPNHGAITDIYYGFGPHRDFSKLFYPRERSGLVHNGAAGVVVDHWNSPFGKVKLNPDKFIRRSGLPTAAGTGDVNLRPATPALGVAAAGGGNPGFAATVQGRVDGADAAAGAYRYVVVAVNRFGKSVPTASTLLAAAAAAQLCNCTITDGSPAGVTTGYEIYRSVAGGAAGTERLIFKASRTGAVTVVPDNNRFLPGTNKVYFFQRNLEGMGWKQLLPFLKVPLAQIDLTIRWAQILYGAFELYAPRKHGMLLNVRPL